MASNASTRTPFAAPVGAGLGLAVPLNATVPFPLDTTAVPLPVGVDDKVPVVTGGCVVEGVPLAPPLGLIDSVGVGWFSSLELAG